MDLKRRQLGLLGAILIVLAAVLYWQSTRREQTPEEFAAAVQQSTGAAQAPATDVASVAPGRRARPAAIPAVQLASLEQSQPEPSDTGRDPFSFGAPAGDGSRAGSPGPVGAPRPPVSQAAEPAAPAGPPPPPPIALKFIGVARQGAGRLYAVLRDDRGMYYGADGDVVEGRYRILRVTMDTVEVSYVDGRGRVRIPMSGSGPRP